MASRLELESDATHYNEPVSNTQSSSSRGQRQDETPSSSSAYKAPFSTVKDPRNTHVPGGYIVNFFPGHTIEQHSTAVGREMLPHVGAVIPIRIEDRVYYTGHNIDGVLLDLIRTDERVESVREEVQGRWPQSRDTGEESVPETSASTGYSVPAR